MKLVRYGEAGRERPGMIDAEGGVRSLVGVVDDISPETLAGGLVDRLRGLDPALLERVAPGARLGPPLSRVGNFVAVGLNYAEHATETDAAIPAEPILFNKAPSCVVGPNDDVALPSGSAKTDWEVEIAFVVGRRASCVAEADALAHVAGYTICNDISERAYQLERGGQWVKGKCFPTFGPLGPWLVTPDEIADPQTLGLWMEVNGERMQNSNTRTMIFPIRELVAYISRHMILEPGDVVTTGTPPGVGLGMKPERYLKVGDVMRLGVDGLGEQRQQVRAWAAA